MTNLISQRELIQKNNWDIILLLDAVRYDFFSKVYLSVLSEVLSDRHWLLEKVSAVGTASQPWFFENFEKGNPRDDIIYLAPDFELSTMDTKFMNFDYKLHYGGKPYNINHFFNHVVDVWKYGYDKKYGIVLPDTITNETIKYTKQHPDKRIIGNYFQVHDPYTCLLKDGSITRIDMQKLATRGRPEYNRYTMVNLKNFMRYILCDETIWTLRKKLGFMPRGGLAEIWLKYGKQGIIDAYTKDLILTLESAKRVVDEFPDKKIIITTDHGEKLGENGNYGHGGRRSNELVEIPWLSIGGK